MGEGLRRDPALERWAPMRDHVHLYWKFTPGRLMSLFVTLVAIPYGTYKAIQWSMVPNGCTESM